jgi:lipoprotein-anchoring transpeptidase ErfK/SrfK
MTALAAEAPEPLILTPAVVQVASADPVSLFPTSGPFFDEEVTAETPVAVKQEVISVKPTEVVTSRPVAPLKLGEVSPMSLPLPSLRKPKILVEKSARRLSVFDGEKMVKSYRVATGGGTGDKTREGDECTPEGEFYVCVKNPQSQHVLSLGLSYPNIEDAELAFQANRISRGQYQAIVEAIRAGRRPPWNTPLGGEIMIHGRRDQRENTLGCVAMDNDAIRELYPKIPLGTRVIIRP